MQAAVTYTLHCPDAAVSAILGRGGSTIKELIAVSGASIKISQKGDFAPGTQHRIVTIMGAEQVPPCSGTTPYPGPRALHQNPLAPKSKILCAGMQQVAQKMCLHTVLYL